MAYFSEALISQPRIARKQVAPTECIRTYQRDRLRMRHSCLSDNNSTASTLDTSTRRFEQRTSGVAYIRRLCIILVFWRILLKYVFCRLSRLFGTYFRLTDLDCIVHLAYAFPLYVMLDGQLRLPSLSLPLRHSVAI